MTPAKAFHLQGESCARLGSPFMARLMTILADGLDPAGKVGQAIHGWPGDASLLGDVVPLRLAGGLHNLVLTGRDRGLSATYPPNSADDSTLAAAVAVALSTHADFLVDWLQSPPQTNEVRRSAAILPGLATITRTFGLPLCLSELGASAGLNLLADRFRLKAGEQILGDAESAVRLRPNWQGDPPPDAAPNVVDRAGVDLAPIDLYDDTALTRLLSYLWPDQPDRATLTRAAAAMAVSAGLQVDRGDAAQWLKNRLETPRPGHVHVVFHTVAFQYFPQSSRACITELMEQAGRSATPDAPLAWLSMEADGDTASAGLTLRIWPGDVTLNLGRADFHGRWIDFRDSEPN